MTGSTRADLLTAADRRAGAIVSEAIVSHHRRRLAKAGHPGSLDAKGAGWATAGPEPRPGCSLEVLIDGAEALPRIAHELQQARSHVYLAGWFFSPEFDMTRNQEPSRVRDVLADLAERVDVRVLTWAGAPLPLFRPSRKIVRRMRDNLCRGTRIRCALDARERPMHCHHEKTIVIDDRIAFVGGIDLTLDNGDRFDSSEHVARGSVGWHDVASKLEGPAVADLAGHFRMRWHEVTGERLAGPEAQLDASAGQHTVQIARTIPERVYEAVPHGEFGILESYLAAVRSAQTLVYLENQFVWSPEIARALCDKLRNPPSDEFRLVLVLPAHPNTGGEDTRGTLGELIEADAGRGQVVACSLYARRGPVADPVYVHAKVGIVDDRWLTLGSANLNDHSLFNDTEVNVVTLDPALVRATRLRLWAEHLECTIDEASHDTTRLVDERWKPISAEQLERRSDGLPLTHRLVRLPHLTRRTGRLLGPLQGLIVDG
jgi:phosphatidylserine/phosphatidylglycerophosphate/cardiolipin synthase-like enzyme